MGYSASEFEQDAAKAARTLHAAYLRAKYLQSRWFSGVNAEFPNSGGTIKHNDLMNRLGEIVTDFEASGNAKLNTILALSDITLPGDE